MTPELLHDRINLTIRNPNEPPAAIITNQEAMSRDGRNELTRIKDELTLITNRIS